MPAITDAQQAREVERRCAEGSGGPQALTSFGTTDVARDMDVLRAALGDEKLSYLGYSYGTQLGAVYAEMTAFQKAFEWYAAGCTTSSACPLGNDPARPAEKFQTIVGPLLEARVPTTDGCGLDHDDAVGAVASGLYSPALWPEITAGLAEVAAGRGDVLQARHDAALGRGPDGRYNDLMDAVTVIRCMDSPRRTPAGQTDLARQLIAAAPILEAGRPVPEAHHECEAWPEPPTLPRRWLTGPVGLAPTLTVSITGDPATPYQGGVNPARVLGGSQLTVEGAQHGVAMLGRARASTGSSAIT